MRRNRGREKRNKRRKGKEEKKEKKRKKKQRFEKNVIGEYECEQCDQLHLLIRVSTV